MRNYARKMAAVRLPPERMRDLKAYCRAAREDDAKRFVIDGAMEETLRGDRLDRWIRESVLRGLGYDAMQARGIPCSHDTFRLYRARFFKALAKRTPVPGRYPPTLPSADTMPNPSTTANRGWKRSCRRG